MSTIATTIYKATKALTNAVLNLHRRAIVGKVKAAEKKYVKAADAVDAQYTVIEHESKRCRDLGLLANTANRELAAAQVEADNELATLPKAFN